MKSEMIFSGIGGQGTILMGKLVCTAAAAKGMNVTLAPAYGQEKRGGRASCQVVLSKEIGSPVISEADTILVMDEESFKDYEKKVKAGGTLIINSSMISLTTARTDINVVEMPFTEIATNLGSARSSNMVALGAVVKTLDIVTLEDVKEVLRKKMKPQLVDVNLKALEAGYNFTK
ncbi:2-oxoacid:acceptor oxidoreductase family protein [Anaerotignum sp. MB30-C6]|uniref:2-oxoacid:acceptor oxidoreductase family protein n=1 Tax=Anaerotignum sp. MB30-C6 TaxID=3070814 RepID=UPI0027DBC1AC|nr:2-oxoacid:acceptor oxidoreductase family protein [Anaerotignum sp. MB30-C6]WMI82332.1 2-oxoacid:acceptor oxidoreductase family protein [Anaerotignum sp. MB30-C6]